MQDQGIAGRERASVTGLGVCDVWRLELTASSGRGWPTSLRRFARRLRRLRRAWAQQALDDDADVAVEISAREYELQLIRMMREQLAPRGNAEDCGVRWPSRAGARARTWRVDERGRHAERPRPRCTADRRRLQGRPGQGRPPRRPRGRRRSSFATSSRLSASTRLPIGSGCAENQTRKLRSLA